MLSDKDLRAAYDKFGKDASKPSEGFVDPAEFFSSIFGGDAFVDWIGEISLMKDLTATMDITMTGEEAEAAAAAEAEAAAAGEAEFPGTEEAKRESAKAAAAAGEGAAGPAAQAPPVVVVEDEKASEPAAGAEKSAGSPPPAAPEAAAAAPPPPPYSPSPAGTSTPSRHAIPIRPALMDRPSDESQLAGQTEEEKELRRKEKKKGLSKEQKEQLAAYEQERAKVREERVKTLAQKLQDRISVWTETDKGPDVTKAFQEKIRLEVENLKMESFGLDILQAIGQVYLSKGTALLKSQKFLGIGGFFSRMKDKGTLVKETWNTISSAIDAQQTMEEMARMEQQGGDEWTDEKKSEYERRVTGKILTAAWRGSKFEIQSVLREVCDTVLNDKKVPLSKRLERAQALVLIAEICSKVCCVQPVCVGENVVLTTYVSRPRDRPKRKGSTWHSSNSWLRRPSRRRRRRTRRGSTGTATTATTATRHQRSRPRPRRRLRRKHRGGEPIVERPRLGLTDSSSPMAVSYAPSQFRLLNKMIIGFLSCRVWNW